MAHKCIINNLTDTRRHHQNQDSKKKIQLKILNVYKIGHGNEGG